MVQGRRKRGSKSTKNQSPSLFLLPPWTFSPLSLFLLWPSDTNTLIIDLTIVISTTSNRLTTSRGDCIVKLLSLSTMAFRHQHPYHRFDHHHLHHKQPPDHLTWWLRCQAPFSLSSLQPFFFILQQPTAAINSSTSTTTSHTSDRPPTASHAR